MIPRCENLYSTMVLRPTVDTCTRIYSRRFISGLPGDTSYTFRCWVKTSSNQENPKLSVYFMAVFVPLGLSFRAIKISWLKAYLETGANWEGKEKNTCEQWTRCTAVDPWYENVPLHLRQHDFSTCTSVYSGVNVIHETRARCPIRVFEAQPIISY